MHYYMDISFSFIEYNKLPQSGCTTKYFKGYANATRISHTYITDAIYTYGFTCVLEADTLNSN